MVEEIFERSIALFAETQSYNETVAKLSDEFDYSFFTIGRKFYACNIDTGKTNLICLLPSKVRTNDILKVIDE